MMNKYIRFVLTAFFAGLSTWSVAHEHAGEIRYVQEKQAFDVSYQRQLMQTKAWREFRLRHPSWHVIFNESNQKPHRAYGNAIATDGRDLLARSWQFIASELQAFDIPAGALELIGTHESAKYQFVNFRQLYQGLEIINSRLTLKFTKQGEIVLFGLDVFNNIQLNIQPSISESQARLLAQTDLENVKRVSADPQLRVLAIPAEQHYRFRLVRTIHVDAIDHENVPEEWEVLVDAHTGELLSRTNGVVRIAGGGNQPENNGNLRLMGTIYPTHPFNADSLVGLPHLRFTVNGTDYFTDASGVYDNGLPIALPVSGTFPLWGRFSRVMHSQSGTNTPSFTLSIDSLLDTVLYDGLGTAPAVNSIRHLSAYYHTTLIHDYMKSLKPNFTALDFPITTRVDRTDGTCNAFYQNGNISVNYYVTAGGCNALSMVADVVYHEYGHAITHRFYNSFGLPFGNGAMGEGYSDIYAITLTGNPVLGIGFSVTNQNTFIRRYDVNPKIFPQNLVGQVHADGEIICGAWWRTAGAIGNSRTMMEILSESMYALAMEPNGREGVLYTDILIDALQADDDDNNLANGTPNFNAIVNSFGFHGISLLANVDFSFSPFSDAAHDVAIPLSVNVNISAPFDQLTQNVSMVYRVNTNAPTAPRDTLRLIATSGNTYTGTLPAQPRGTLIHYFIALSDAAGNLSAAKPNFATDPTNPNLWYNMLIGMTGYDNHTFENPVQDNDFVVGFSTDNATDGIWELGTPIPSFATLGDPSSITQPGNNATPGGSRAAFTKNAPNQNSPISAADVDGGRTTLLSPVYDLSRYINPVLTYERWFTNDMGDSPNLDLWQVFISNDGGTNWQLIERTRRSDRSWRRAAIRVTDFIQPTNQVRIRFVAADLPPESVVEAAIDDIWFYDLSPATGIAEQRELAVRVYPNPSKGEFYVALETTAPGLVNFEISNLLGQQLWLQTEQLGGGAHEVRLQPAKLAAGMYLLRIQSNGAANTHRIIVE